MYRCSRKMALVWKIRRSDSKCTTIANVVGCKLLGNRIRISFFSVCRGKVTMPHRITRPWLLFDWVYGMTETASAEISQKNKLDTFTRKVIIIIIRLSA